MAAATRSRDAPRPLPELELAVMKELWRMRSATVGRIQERLEPSRPLAYTTVMTVLDRLARKRVVARSKRGKRYHYRPILSREAARDEAVERLVADFFDGSEERLSAYLKQRREMRNERPGPSGVAAGRRIASQAPPS